MNHYDAIKKLMPLELGEISDLDISVESVVLDNAYLKTLSVIDELFPSTANLTLSSWESEYGIVPSVNSTIEQRRNKLVQKVRETGGLDIPYFKSLALALGYNITVTEARRPWIVGVSKVGDWVGIKALLFTCTINVDALSAPELEEVLEDLKSPHLKLNFIYN